MVIRNRLKPSSFQGIVFFNKVAAKRRLVSLHCMYLRRQFYHRYKMLWSCKNGTS